MNLETTCKIHMKDGHFFLCDLQDYFYLRKFKWVLDCGKYASLSRGDGKKMLAHRVITLASDGYEVDHINSNKLDNRKVNLRVCLRAENSRNAAKRQHREGASAYKGVRIYKKRNGETIYHASLCFKDKHYWLGSFKTEIEAAIAYDKKAIEVHKEFSRTNFCITNYQDMFPKDSDFSQRIQILKEATQENEKEFGKETIKKCYDVVEVK